MTAEPVLMLTPRCPLLSPTSLRCVGCCLHRHLFVLCSMCVFFIFFPSLSVQPGTQTVDRKRKYCFGEIWLRDSGWTCVSVCVRVLAGSGVGPRNWGELGTSSSLFQTTAGAEGLHAWVFYYKWSVWMKPASSLLAFKLEEITDDIRAGESKGEKKTTQRLKHLTCLFWENGIPLLISSW